MSHPDTTIKQTLLRRLERDSSIDASYISVEVAQGQVRLTGKVESLWQRKEASLVAWSVHGVESIDNRIEIYESEQGDKHSDSQLSDNASVALTIHSQTAGSVPGISVQDGIVTLSGTVDALWKVKKIENIVSELAGVRGVNNLLTVVPTRSINDEILADAVFAAFQENQYIDEEKIIVEVANGLVTLKGKVLSARMVMEAYDCAARITGITKVKNMIVWG